MCVYSLYTNLNPFISINVNIHISDISVKCVNVTAEISVGTWCHDISHHIFILTQDRPDDTKKRHKDSKKWYSRLDKCDGLSEIFFRKMWYFSYILLTGVSWGDKQHFSFSSQQVETGGAYFYISIFHHNLIRTSGKKREEFYLWWQGGPWCTEHLTSVRMAAELLQRFIFSSDYPPPGLCSFFGEKSWGEKVNVNNRFRLDSNLKQV